MTVCLDLTRERVAAVEVRSGRVTSWFEQELAAGSMAGGAPVDAARLGGQLRRALREAGMAGRRARVAIPDAALITRVVSLPPMPARHLRRAVVFEAERAIPIPVSQALWSWAVLPGAGGGHAVRLVGGWRDVVDKLRLALREADLELDGIEPRSAAIARGLDVEVGLLLELIAGTVYATAIAPGQSPFTAQAPAPEDPARWPTVLEPLVMAARRHLGSAGRKLPVFAGREIVGVLPEAMGARPVASALSRGVALPPEIPSDGCLAAVGLAVRSRRAPRLRPRPEGGTRAVRRRVQSLGAPWVPALALVSAASWSAVVAATALLLGWHPSWPLAP